MISYIRKKSKSVLHQIIRKGGSLSIWHFLSFDSAIIRAKIINNNITSGFIRLAEKL